MFWKNPIESIQCMENGMVGLGALMCNMKIMRKCHAVAAAAAVGVGAVRCMKMENVVRNVVNVENACECD